MSGVDCFLSLSFFFLLDARRANGTKKKSERNSQKKNHFSLRFSCFAPLKKRGHKKKKKSTHSKKKNKTIPLPSACPRRRPRPPTASRLTQRKQGFENPTNRERESEREKKERRRRRQRRQRRQTPCRLSLAFFFSLSFRFTAFLLHAPTLLLLVS